MGDQNHRLYTDNVLCFFKRQRNVPLCKILHLYHLCDRVMVVLADRNNYILDRSTATGASDEGVMGAREVIENELIQELDVYKNGRIVYFIDHANVWYTSTGGVQALDTMLADLEGALLNETSS